MNIRNSLSNRSFFRIILPIYPFFLFRKENCCKKKQQINVYNLLFYIILDYFWGG